MQVPAEILLLSSLAALSPVSGLYLKGAYFDKKISVCNGASVKQGSCSSCYYCMHFFDFWLKKLYVENWSLAMLSLSFVESFNKYIINCLYWI